MSKRLVVGCVHTGVCIVADPHLLDHISSHPIDNNPIENNFHAIAIGRKNWLFTGSERAGQRAAVIESLLATAKLNGLDPAKWLTETLEKLPTWPSSRIDELLPFKPEVIKTLMKECG